MNPYDSCQCIKATIRRHLQCKFYKAGQLLLCYQITQLIDTTKQRRFNLLRSAVYLQVLERKVF